MLVTLAETVHVLKDSNIKIIFWLLLLSICFAHTIYILFILFPKLILHNDLIKFENCAESLLLGSLHWFLGITCLFILLPLLQSTQLRFVPQEGQENKNQGSLAPGKAESRTSRIWFIQSMMGKRYKASRSRMKSSSVPAGVPCVVLWNAGDQSF